MYVFLSTYNTVKAVMNRLYASKANIKSILTLYFYHCHNFLCPLEGDISLIKFCFALSKLWPSLSLPLYVFWLLGYQYTSKQASRKLYSWISKMSCSLLLSSPHGKDGSVPLGNDRQPSKHVSRPTKAHGRRSLSPDNLTYWILIFWSHVITRCKIYRHHSTSRRNVTTFAAHGPRCKSQVRVPPERRFVSLVITP